MNKEDWESEVRRGDRFKFGKNWTRFLKTLDESAIIAAEDSLSKMLGTRNLSGKSFLDIGCGSGLFSLAARRLGATVMSFDFDPDSVACVNELRRRFFPDDAHWNVKRGSVLDAEFLRELPEFDVVYSWGVLHHTGNMWEALRSASEKVRGEGQLFVALYNHQPIATRYWSAIKRVYNRIPISRPFLVAVHLVYPTLPSVVLRIITGRKSPRGMSLWFDLLDWLGGYPFETARPEEVFDFFRDRDFTLMALKTAGGRLGCNEFVFGKSGSAS